MERRRARCLDAGHWKTLTTGKEYTILEIDPDDTEGEGYITILDDDDDIASFHISRFELVS